MKLWEMFLKALYPENTACCHCNRDGRLNEYGFCESCTSLIEKAGKAQLPPYADDITSALLYNDAASSMIRRFKYHNARYLGKSLAALIQLPSEWQIDVILPVPLHAQREKKRGYNQSLILAGHLGERYSLPVRANLIKRMRNTPSQALSSPEERYTNLKDAFKASHKCKGLSILLVDDVITTGSTSGECAKALKEAGANKVYLAAVCSSPHSQV